MAADPTTAAIPFYWATMGAEHLYLRRRAQRMGAPAPTDYELRDTIASLTMGFASLAAPMVMPKLVGPLVPGKGRYGKVLVGVAAAAAVATTVTDVWSRRRPDGSLPPAGVLEPSPPGHLDAEVGTAGIAGTTAEAGEAGANRSKRRQVARWMRRIGSSTAVTAVAAGTTAVATAWTAQWTAQRLWPHRVVKDLGTGVAAMAVAMVGWDFIYYWNHRFMHESRFMWAIHVVHHSSERYNLSTALRQPVADTFGTFVPYGVLSLLGVRPDVIRVARGWNLLYQYWIHTDAIGKLGRFEEVFNTPSHHRVHHGTNQQYLDRNHGGILITWDRLFGTFEREDEPVVYGLTKNIGTFNPLRIASHEYADILRDVARSDNWSDRLSFVVRGPGWAYRRHAIEAVAHTGGGEESPAEGGSTTSELAGARP